MTNVAEKKAAELGSSQANASTSNKTFHFCDLMCADMEGKDGQKGTVPIPIFLEGETDEFLLMCWNFWCCLACALKKELRTMLTREELKSIKGRNSFSLMHENGTYTFFVHQDWLAQRLNIPTKICFQQKEPTPKNSTGILSPTDVFKELQIRCFFANGTDDKKKPALSFQQKLLAIKKGLGLPEKCELNLMLTFLTSAAARKK